MPQKRTTPRVCETCAAPFLTYPSVVKRGEGRFCSRPCSATGRLAPRTRCVCEQCGAEYDIRTSLKTGPEKNRGRYCSHACRNDARRRDLTDIWRFIDRRGPDECWPCKTHRNWRGYGRITIASQTLGVTRVVLGLKLGRPLAPNEFALHHCDNPPCANPAHLYAGDVQQNANDKVERQRQARGERHGLARLTAEHVREIRVLAANGGLTHLDIAQRYAVHKTTVTAILAGKTWQHLI